MKIQLFYLTILVSIAVEHMYLFDIEIQSILYKFYHFSKKSKLFSKRVQDKNSRAVESP